MTIARRLKKNKRDIALIILQHSITPDVISKVTSLTEEELALLRR